MEKELGQIAVSLSNTPSVIPQNNPALCVYSYNTQKYDGYPIATVCNWDQYYIDLDKANAVKIEFELEYAACGLYGVDHFDGDGVSKAISNLAGD